MVAVVDTVGKCIKIDKFINNTYLQDNSMKFAKDVMLVVGIQRTTQALYLTVMSPLEKYNKCLVVAKDQTCTVINDNEVNEYFTHKKILQNIPMNVGSSGADPEIFVVDENDTIIPAFKFLPDKANGNPFWDGFQAEFTIASSHCIAYVVDYIQSGLYNVLRLARKYNPKAKLTWKSVLDIPSNLMEQATAEHLALGCAPSSNIYGTQITRPDPNTLPFRFAGCHLHFGMKEVSNEVLKNIITAMDNLFGIMSVALLQCMEDPRRRFYYGLAGEYRLPAHGLEYRMPSSALLAHPALCHLCYDLARLSINIGELNILPALDLTLRDEEIIDIINSYDVKTAKAYLNKHKTIIKIILQKLYHYDMPSDKFYDKLFNLIVDGFINHIDISNMEKNWLLKSGWITHSESANCCVHKMELPDDLL